MIHGFIFIKQLFLFLEFFPHKSDISNKINFYKKNPKSSLCIMIRVFNKVIIGECAYLIRREISILYTKVVKKV